MNNILSLEFGFENKIYYSMVRIKQWENVRSYHITIMNSELARTLLGHNIILEKNGELVSEPEPVNKKAAKLKQAIVQALRNEMYGNESTQLLSSTG